MDVHAVEPRRSRELGQDFAGIEEQLGLATQALEPARGAIARALDALQALLAALADSHRLGLDLAAALDREADRIRVGASGHDSRLCSEIAAGAARTTKDSRLPAQTELDAVAAEIKEDAHRCENAS